MPRLARSDAARNAALILDAGRAALREHGPGVPFYEVARTAGVGQATLYRHFPNKQALVHAIAEQNVDALAEATGDAERFDHVLEALGESMAENAEVAVLLAAEAGTDWYEALVERVVDILERALVLGQAAGELRADLDRRDLRLVLQLLAGAPTAGTLDERRRQARRAVDICLRGTLTGR